MTRLTFILPDGSARDLDVEPGPSLMETALRNNIAGIVAECGGAMACATCHVFVDDATMSRIGAPCGNEADMLDMAAVERRPTSRLSCQVAVGPELAGAVITVPGRQV